MGSFFLSGAFGARWVAKIPHLFAPKIFRASREVLLNVPAVSVAEKQKKFDGAFFEQKNDGMMFSASGVYWIAI